MINPVNLNWCFDDKFALLDLQLSLISIHLNVVVVYFYEATKIKQNSLLNILLMCFRLKNRNKTMKWRYTLVIFYKISDIKNWWHNIKNATRITQERIQLHQFGFRRDHLTVQQIHRITHVINQSIWKKTLLHFNIIRVSQAFDKVLAPRSIV